MYEAESALRQATLQGKAAQSQYDVLMLRPRPQAIAEAKTRIDAAQAAVDTAKAQVEQLTIRAPIAGVLNSLTCRLGQTLSVGTEVGEVVDARRINVVVWLSVAEAQRVMVDQAANISTCDATGTTKDEIAGKVTVVGKVADAQTGNLPVRILVENAAGKLTLGQAVSAAIVVREENVLAVPVEAVHDLGEDTVLNVVRDGKTVVLHPKLGLKDPHWIAVSDTDLKPDEPVVVEGGYNLPDGTEVGVEMVEEAKPAGAEKVVEKPGTKEWRRPSRQFARRRPREARPEPRRAGQAVLRAARVGDADSRRLRRDFHVCDAQRHLSGSRLSADHRNRRIARPGRDSVEVAVTRPIEEAVGHGAAASARSARRSVRGASQVGYRFRSRHRNGPGPERRAGQDCRHQCSIPAGTSTTHRAANAVGLSDHFLRRHRRPRSFGPARLCLLRSAAADQPH